MTYEQLAAKIAKGRTCGPCGYRACRLPGNATIAYQESATLDLIVQHHTTKIVVLYLDGRVALHTNGWHTVTTKERMNRFLPPGWYLYQHDWEWYVQFEHDEPITFFDGIILEPNGRWS